MKNKTIFTIGSATFDIFIKPEEQAVFTIEKANIREKWLALKHGGKIRIEQVIETFGGGAANTAVAFARMGHDAFFVGKIGAEYGDRVIDNLLHEKVDTSFARKTTRERTGFSTIINTLDGDRTVLGYAGANRLFSPGDLPLNELGGADWIYLSHVSGDSDGILKALGALLKKHPKIRLAWNPGHEQFLAGASRWRELLSRTDLLFLNKEEASLFSKTPYRLAGNKKPDPQLHVGHPRTFLPPYADDVTEIFAALLKFGPRIVVITDGRNGAQASDGKQHYFCPVVTHKRVSTLGAGDAFASGFTSAFMYGKNLKDALIYGTLNANSVVSEFGAQGGLLTLKEMERERAKSPVPVSVTRFNHP